jgi:hypothetical protein
MVIVERNIGTFSASSSPAVLHHDGDGAARLPTLASTLVVIAVPGVAPCVFLSMRLEERTVHWFDAKH